MMLEKFDSKTHKSLLKGAPFVYDLSLPYLDFAGYILERNGQKNLAIQDILYPNTFPYLYLPKSEKNWVNSHILWTTKEDLEKLGKKVEITDNIPLGEEFYYATKDFINLQGKDWSRFRQRVNQFEREYKYKITDNYDKTKIKSFLKLWLKNQAEKTVSFEESYNFFNFCLENIKKYNIKSVFVEIDNKLAGVALGVAFDKRRWIGLHLKVDYKYKGLSRFLHKKRAELFSNYEIFTLGHGGAGDKGIEQFKKELHPYKTVEHFYVITGKLKTIL